MSLWSAFLFDHDNVIFSKQVRNVALMMPLYLIISFACVSLGIIGYRVATFNDCINAASELKQQLKEARKDLEKRGFKFELQ
ncbi:dolichol-phosphate mannosyltransferase subunit 3 [Octopus bimaculoides]|nr:dolichol-phosphate mannosyltransferase subunit 3 [Octopus bimaculoides]|eukprot:XP_014773126.1 PREDICTED: dolichol-phosphate mannosyltransferase subunit 3-like [Octopus bimaculoides]